VQVDIHSSLLDHPGRPGLLIALIFAAALVLPVAGAAGEDESPGPWPQWRGPEGLGVSGEPNLPVVWDKQGKNIKWRLPIPGLGNSSPIVSNGRVILTTAYDSRRAGLVEGLIATASCVLAAIFVGLALRRYFKSGQAGAKAGPPAGTDRTGALAGTVLRWATAVPFIVLALFVIVGAEHANPVLAAVGDRLEAFEDEKLGDLGHLITMDEGVRAGVWLTAGGIAMFGLAAAAAWVATCSVLRIVLACAVLLGATALVIWTPPDQWKEQIELWQRLVFFSPALAAAAACLLSCLQLGPEPGAKAGNPESVPDKNQEKPGGPERMRLSWKIGDPRCAGKFGSPASAVVLVVLSVLVFVPPNFFAADLGVARVVLCADAETGELLWEKTVFTERAERKHKDSTYAMPTPAADGRHIIVNFGVGVACLDFEGNLLWRKEDPEYVWNTRYGAVASPVLVEDMAIVLQESEWDSKRPTWLAAFDKQTGRQRWRINPTNIHECFTTPLVYRDRGDVQLIIASWGNVASYDARTGKRLWIRSLTTQQLVASPAREGQLLCIGGGTWPKDADGTIMMRLERTAKGPGASFLWRSEKDTPEDCSPVIYQGRLYTLSDRGKMSCYDAVTGEIFWNERLKGSRFLSSLVAGDGKVYASNVKGLTTVVAADSQFKILAQNDLGGRCYASPAIANGRIYMRVGGVLYCIEEASAAR